MKPIHWVILIVGLTAVAVYAVVNRYHYETLGLGTLSVPVRVDSWTGERCVILDKAISGVRACER